MKKALLLLILVIFQTGQAGGAHLKEFGFLSGWGEGCLKEEVDDYEILRLSLRLGFDISSKFLKEGSQGMIEFIVEPFMNPVFSPDSNVEVGCGLFLKYAHPISSCISPYIEAGTGPLYTTQDLKSQATRWNFLSQCGVGVHYFFRDDASLNIGYRIGHFSNAGLEHPNSGVDVHSFLVGFSFYY